MEVLLCLQKSPDVSLPKVFGSLWESLEVTVISQSLEGRKEVFGSQQSAKIFILRRRALTAALRSFVRSFVHSDFGELFAQTNEQPNERTNNGERTNDQRRTNERTNEQRRTKDFGLSDFRDFFGTRCRAV